MTYRAYLLVLVAVVAVTQATANVMTVAHTRDQMAAAVRAPAPPPPSGGVAPPAALAGGVGREAPPAPSLPPLADTTARGLDSLPRASGAPGITPMEAAPASAWSAETPCDPSVSVTCVAPAPAWDAPAAP